MLGVSGTFIIVSTQNTEMKILGWFLVGIGCFFLALNMALRQRPR